MGMQQVNDAIGGVTVTMSEDWEIDGRKYTKGQTIKLVGKEANDFLFRRDTDEFGSNMMRVSRQQDYLHALIPQLKEAAKADIGIVTKVYEATSGYMYTNMSLPDIISLASEALTKGYSFGDVQVLPGEYVEGKGHDEYNVDTDAVYEMVIQNYYVPVEETADTNE